MKSLLDLLSADERMELIRNTTERRFGNNEVVFHAGDLPDSLHIVSRGVFVAKVYSRGGHVLAINEFPPGAVFGELGVLADDALRTASLFAPRKGGGSTRMLRRADFIEMRRRPIGQTIERFLLDELASRSREMTENLVELLFTPAPRRISRHLVRLGQPAFPDVGDGWHHISQDDIAERTATTRATVNRALRSLEQRRIVELGRGRIRVLDREQLVRLAR